MNGWKNYPTWAASVWGLTDIEPAEYERVVHAAAAQDRDSAVWAIAHYLRDQFLEWTYEEVARVQDRRGYASLLDDLLFYAVGDIDWQELADSIYRDYAGLQEGE